MGNKCSKVIPVKNDECEIFEDSHCFYKPTSEMCTECLEELDRMDKDMNEMYTDDYLDEFYGRYQDRYYYE